MKTMSDIKLKATLLSHGVAISESALDNYGYPFLEKRRAYGNPDPNDMRNRTVPQELYTLPERLITAVNINHESQWKLTFDNGRYFITDEQDFQSEVTFPKRPKFYDEMLSTGEKVSQIITLYGGSALGIFVYGKCSLAEMEEACSYCSVLQNRFKGTDFVDVIKPNHVKEALSLALQDYSVNIKQVMINGGNFKDLDKNFTYYAQVTRLADKIIHQSKREVDLHLIVFPPKDLSLFKEIKDTSVGVIMNTEVFDPELFKKYCPGKNRVLGRENILNALEIAVMVLGKGRVFSVILGGLEPIDSLYKGLLYLAERGISPIINVLHTDPETPMESFPNPSVECIIEMGQALQEVYEKYHLKACYEDCGRNSIDTEAYKRLFI